jgi:hypothetical protein
MSSRLQQMMAAKRAASTQDAVVPVIPTKIVDPVTPSSEVASESNIEGNSNFVGVANTTGLANISLMLSQELSAADQRVHDQREAGVYDLPAEATELLGAAESAELIKCMELLDAALITKTPEIRTLSRSIRQNLEQYPELTHILKESQLHIMVQGYLMIAGVKTAPKSAAGKKAMVERKADASIKAAAGKSVDDLF